MKKHTVCRLCSSCCPVEVEIIDNKLVSATRKSFVDQEKRLRCPRLNRAADIVYSPNRLTKPLIREKNTSTFKEASWDEALDLVVARFNRYKNEFGAESVAWLRGMAADWGAPWDYANRLMNVYGSPNTIGNGSICFVAREMAHTYTYGSMAYPEAAKAKCILVWGKHDRDTTMGVGDAIEHALENGAKLIVVDPIKTLIAERADIWLQIKPGHDGLLAMAMINEIIINDLYDTDFVENFSTGFDELKEVAGGFPAERIAGRIWLEPGLIKEAARLYATTKPACIVDGNGLDMQLDIFDSTRAVAFLRGLTGNIDTEGGDVLPQPVAVRDIQAQDSLPTDVEPVTADYPLFNTFNATWGKQVQSCVVDSILDEKPYPLKMVVVQSGNPVVTMADSTRTTQGFKKLDFLVVIDMFMTRTAELADVILPACSCFEKTQLNRASIRNNPVILQDQVIDPIGDSWPDWQIVFELGRRLGFEKEFPWRTAEAAIDYQLEPAGITVEMLRKSPNGLRVEDIMYEKHRKNGFATPSTKFEFSSQTLQENGFPQVPYGDGFINNPISFSDQNKFYPIYGISGARNNRFTNSQFRAIPSLLDNESGCVVDIHPVDAEKMRVGNGDKVNIETPKGSIQMEAKISQIVHQGSIRIAWGWGDYNPDCNLNSLTDDDRRNPITGTPSQRSFMCRVTKVQDL